MYWLFYSAIFISAALAAHYGPKILTSFWSRLLAQTAGYLMLVCAFLAACFSSDFNFSQLIGAPQNFFSYTELAIMFVGLSLMIASIASGGHRPGDDDNFNNGDPWGPDFDRARAAWEKQYRPTKKS